MLTLCLCLWVVLNGLSSLQAAPDPADCFLCCVDLCALMWSPCHVLSCLCFGDLIQKTVALLPVLLISSIIAVSGFIFRLLMTLSLPLPKMRAKEWAWSPDSSCLMYLSLLAIAQDGGEAGVWILSSICCAGCPFSILCFGCSCQERVAVCVTLLSRWSMCLFSCWYQTVSLLG